MVRAVLRTKSVTTKVTEAEYVRLEELAQVTGVNMSEWIRGRLLSRDIGEHTARRRRRFLRRFWLCGQF